MATSESRNNAFHPGPILLMGAPGVGKGTQAKLLVRRWSIPQISTGDLLRANVSSGSELGTAAKHLMDAGTLVSDDLVNRMVEQRLTKADTLQGYILDGFPRTLAQAEWLDDQLGGNANALPLVAVSIRVEYNQLLRRVTGRRICPKCGRIYNVFLQPPARNGVCDADGTPLQSRDDDSESVFEGRMRAYEDQTAPVLHHYQALHRLIEVPGEGEPEAIADRLEAAVQGARKQQES